MRQEQLATSHSIAVAVYSGQLHFCLSTLADTCVLRVKWLKS